MILNVTKFSHNFLPRFFYVLDAVNNATLDFENMFTSYVPVNGD